MLHLLPSVCGVVFLFANVLLCCSCSYCELRLRLLPFADSSVHLFLPSSSLPLSTAHLSGDSSAELSAHIMLLTSLSRRPSVGTNAPRSYQSAPPVSTASQNGGRRIQLLLFKQLKIFHRSVTLYRPALINQSSPTQQAKFQCYESNRQSLRRPTRPLVSSSIYSPVSGCLSFNSPNDSVVVSPTQSRIEIRFTEQFNFPARLLSASQSATLEDHAGRVISRNDMAAQWTCTSTDVTFLLQSSVFHAVSVFAILFYRLSLYLSNRSH